MEVELTFENLFNKLSYYMKSEDLNQVKKAYLFAVQKHLGQKRLSGHEYIEHPIATALFLADKYLDVDTICAALLHDVIEDSDTTKEDIAQMFNPTVALLVDGVTKINKLDFSTKDEQLIANQKKILLSITQDVRIILIKLADRVHNTETLEFQSPKKQRQKAIENFEIYIPLAYHLGLYDVKRKLEDLSFKYTEPEQYAALTEKVNILKENSAEVVFDVLNNVNKVLMEQNLIHNIEARIKSVYTIYKSMLMGKTIEEINDLIAFKVSVEQVRDCYYALGLIHSLYHPIHGQIKDYIAIPKTNLYQSLHTVVFGPLDKTVQFQIRTNEMNAIARAGITYNWSKNKGEIHPMMVQDLKDKYQFFKSIVQLYNYSYNDLDFVGRAKEEILQDSIYVYTYRGEVIELPVGSTPVDFAFRISDYVGTKMEAVVINNIYAPLDTELHNKDMVKIITNPYQEGPKIEWVQSAKTRFARRKIREYHEQR